MAAKLITLSLTSTGIPPFLRSFRGVLMGTISDELFNTDIDSAKLCRSTANHLIKLLASPSASDISFIEHIVKMLRQPTEKISGKVDSEKMWSEFHKVRSSDEYCKKWQEYLLSVGCQPNPVFYQHITTELFEQILKEKLHSLQETMCPETAQEEVSITLDEENAIRYMAGYVLRKLKNNKIAIDYLVQKDREYIDQTSSTQWVKLIDRGGLVHVTEECHQLFLSMELVIRHYMHAEKLELMDERCQEHLTNMILLDDDVLFNWTMTGGEDEATLKEIVQLWISIRGNSFAKSIMEKYKKKSKKITSKSKGLRTKLFTDQI